MRKRIILALLLLCSFAVTVTQCCMLNRVLPCAIITLSNEPGKEVAAAAEKSKNVQIAAFSRSTKVLVLRSYGRMAHTTVYRCDAAWFSMAGTKLVCGSMEGAVLDERLAALLFAGGHCLGERIQVGRNLYPVTGVCKAQGALWRVEEYTLYLPRGEDPEPGAKAGVLVMAKDPTELKFAMQRVGALQNADGVRTMGMFDPALIPTSVIDLTGWWERWSDAAVARRGGEQIPLAICCECSARCAIMAAALALSTICGVSLFISGKDGKKTRACVKQTPVKL